MRLAFSLIALLTVAGPALAAPCAQRLTFVEGVIGSDLKIGFIGQGIYDKMSAELAEADAACKKGDDARAQSLISAAQSRHGYPVR